MNETNGVRIADAGERRVSASNSLSGGEESRSQEA
jgi:hypothetical protein